MKNNPTGTPQIITHLISKKWGGNGVITINPKEPTIKVCPKCKATNHPDNKCCLGCCDKL